MPTPVHPGSYLVSFAEAGRLLGVGARELRQLIAQGHLTPHPILANRIPRNNVERFALQSSDAETDTEERRAVDAPVAAGGWGVPPMRV